MKDAHHIESRKKKYLIFTSIFLAGLLVGLGIVIAYDALSGGSQNASETRENNTQYHFINPLLECNESNISNELETFKSETQDEVTSIINSKQADDIAIYFRDLNNGPSFGINPDEPFIPASLLKVPVMMAYYAMAESNPSILQKKITFTQNLDPNVEYFTAPKLVIGETYTVEQLIEAMIKYSDNNAYDLLLMNMDSNALDQVFQYLDVQLPKDQLVLNVNQYATFFRILFNSSYLNDDDSEHALSLLSQSVFKAGLVAGVPSNIVVAHKFGEKWDSPADDKELHDCGIVYYPNHPYLICIMTKGKDFNTLASVIADLSKFIYNQVDAQAKANG